ncbi:SUMF1/EgtB/PvdO family nonheme iron enzyme [Accumulibacter sp.]|uniref:formylglycine-generating enzyme family protein n=1 Tax=Accumulibacter sp. TaxID=2053492 RepID=UPI0025FA09C0|nr:SUMF1/EgtB/PvdO family nonheme iron enzyme [Accumulibacter sp.]MCP5229301.1 SUMF1/EgtB/PvdO family nonheme iron enzyme [Accumulibacter sp.]
MPALDWVEIPGGDFIYQEGKKRNLPTFHMARYPVTNVQYQTFIKAGGYRDESWWENLVRPETQVPRWPQGNRPRTNVNWYEAVAFSRWLSAQLGYEVRLPTEEEWERAARGRVGRQYPWGDRYESGSANIDEKAAYSGQCYLKQTIAVGVYPHGASAEGVLDLVGHVWEWCLNKYEQPERIVADGTEANRVLRGASWHSDSSLARGSTRDRCPPGGRSVNFGFRLVSSAPIA